MGAFVALVLLLVAIAYGSLGAGGIPRIVMGTFFFFGVFALAGGALTLLVLLLRQVPPLYLWVLAAGVVVLVYLSMIALSVVLGVVVVGLGLFIVASLVGAGVLILARDGWHAMPPLRRVVIVVGLLLGLTGIVLGGIWLLDDGDARTLTMDVLGEAQAPVAPLSLPDPARPGSHEIRTLFYGSGSDRQRHVYAEGVDLVTDPVDGSALISGWSRLRTAYWGFEPDALPLNGRVWYPVGDGPFPLILFLHGQHPMEAYSDPGYAYLGELLASRGFIVASVDENFLNLSPLADLLMFSQLKGADDLRGWLLLEHLRLWRAWAATPGTPFYGTVDMDAIALVGHSRGGEAVAVAAVFNRLDAYPDDVANGPVFDYDFNVRSIVAIAPVDGTYRPAGQLMVLEGVNYLVLHGSHDMDVFTFQGQDHYTRAQLDGGGDLAVLSPFKALFYIHGANHGQFNTVWGRKDLFEPLMRLFNLAQLMDPEEQRQVAEVAISAFMEATLRDAADADSAGYRAFFRDPRRGRAWLPDTLILSRYQDRNTRLISTYEEDVDPTTTTVAGGQHVGEGLSLWQEGPVAAKWETRGNRAVTLGWDLALYEYASYAVNLPAPAISSPETSALVFALADANVDPTPKDGEPWPSPLERSPVDFTVVVVDDQGVTSRLPLSHVAPLLPQVVGTLGKADFMSFLPNSEPVLHRFELPLMDFVAANSDLSPDRLVEVRLVFDRTAAGSIVLDDVGVWSP
jgi:hypothetical protein